MLAVFWIYYIVESALGHLLRAKCFAYWPVYLAVCIFEALLAKLRKRSMRNAD